MRASHWMNNATVNRNVIEQSSADSFPQMRSSAHADIYELNIE